MYSSWNTNLFRYQKGAIRIIVFMLCRINSILDAKKITLIQHMFTRFYVKQHNTCKTGLEQQSTGIEILMIKKLSKLRHSPFTGLHVANISVEYYILSIQRIASCAQILDLHRLVVVFLYILHS